MKHMGFRWVIPGMVGAVLLGLAGLEMRAAVTTGSPDSPAPIRLELTPPKDHEFDIRRDATVAAVEEVMPSVVNVATSRVVEYHDFYDQLRRQFFGLPPQNEPRTQEQLDSLGSGVIIDEDGYILTNWHVVRRATRVQVKLSDGRVFDADKIVATEKSDVALLKIRAQPGEKFKAIKFAKDDDLLLGETVMALGNPFGLGGSVSRGILSSKNRRPATGDEPLNIADWLQTDTAINPGNSGGPLVNLKGELIGINVAVGQGQGIGFAIPARQVSSAISQFFSPEVTYSMWFGARLKAGSRPLTIAEVQDGSPAAKAGLKPGMQISQVNGKVPHSLVDFSAQLMSSVESHVVTLAAIEVDTGRQRTMKVTLETFEDLIKQRTGITLEELTSQAAARLGLRDGHGLMIQSVEKGSPAEKAELKSGMLLAGLDNAAINDLRDLGLALINKGGDESAKLTLLVFKQVDGRGGQYIQTMQGKVDLKLRNP